MNPVKIDSPVIQPYRCLFCTSGHRGGPVIDMLVDVLEGRAYVCMAHAKRIAAAAGFASGEEADKLANAAELLAQAEKGLETSDARNRSMQTQVRELRAETKRLEAELDDAVGRAQQAEAKLSEVGQGIAATLGAVTRSDHLDQLHEMGADLSHLEPTEADRALMEAHARQLEEADDES